ncbi:MAG TPA: hypothetical protein VFD37_04010, partial [Solirubrobacterales bacterium]|nr:hypothetical protein [Solirubrobacterales bacterium]
LDPSLDRRPPPEDAADALRAFPGGLTTAEAASVLRQSDLDEVDIPAAEEQLTALAGEGLAGCEPIGGDAIWRLREAGGDAAAGAGLEPVT